VLIVKTRGSTDRRAGSSGAPIVLKMKMFTSTRQSFLALVALLLSGLAVTPAEARWLRYATPESGSYALAYVPPALEDATGPQPVIVFLHGSGATPSDWQPLLAPHADDLEFVLLLPAAASRRAFGIGDDLGTLRSALDQLRDDVPVDDARISLAGHSAGGAWALVAAYSNLLPVSAVFSLSAPYRTVLETADPDHTAPARLYYGTEDPNYASGQLTAWGEQLRTLGVPVETEIRAGFGHGSWPDSTLPDGFRFLLDARRAGRLGCEPTATRLCLGEGRFEVEVTWSDFQGGSGSGRVAGVRTRDSGLFTFFAADNWELQVKVLDGCALNDYFWVFAAGTTNVGWTLSVRDRLTGEEWSHENPLGQASPAVTDVTALTGCGAEGPGAGSR
jgi:predicted esterase